MRRTGSTLCQSPNESVVETMVDVTTSQGPGKAPECVQVQIPADIPTAVHREGIGAAGNLARGLIGTDEREEDGGLVRPFR